MKNIRKLLSLILALVISAVSVLVMPVMADSTVAVWDGTVSAIEDISGKGTEADPYLITSGADLAYFASTDAVAWAKYLKLTNDIYLNDTTKENWVGTANEWFEGTAQFGGVLDGAGYTIYGLYADSAATDKYSGLFQRVNGNAIIKNLHLRDVNIKAAFAGGFVGYAEFGNLTIENCSVSGKITGVSTGSTKVGGYVGYAAKNTVIKNSYINAEMATTESYGLLGSFIGTFWPNGDTTLTIETSYANTSRAVIENCQAGTVTLTNVYSATAQSAATQTSAQGLLVNELNSSCKGENAKSNMTGFDFEKVWYTVGGGYPVNRESDTVIAWDGTVSAIEDIGGSGTEADPYLITSGADLAYFASTDGVAWAKYLKLTNDIYLNDTTKENWEATANEWYEGKAQFGGVLDGAGYAIYGLYADSAATDKYSGLFQRVNGNAVIKDLHLRDVNIKAAFAGAFVGYAEFGNLTIENCSVSGKITVVSMGGTNVGGFVGYAAKNTVIKNSYINAEMATTESYGLLGSFIGTFWPNGDTTLTIETSYANTSRAVIENCPASAVTLTNVYSKTAQSEATQESAQGLSVNELNSSCKGKNAKTNMEGFDFENVWYTVAGGYPVNRAADVTDGIDDVPIVDIWDGTVSAIENISGSGTEEEPYLIKSGADLAYFASTDGAAWTKYLKLTNDIYLNNVFIENWEATAREWFEGTAQFGGVLDGAGYAIYGLYADSAATDKYSGLFQRSNGNAVIKDLHLRDVNIKAARAGAFVGHITSKDSTLTIENCSVSGEIIGVSILSASRVGGFVGYAEKTVIIKNSYIDASMSRAYNWGYTGSVIGAFWRPSGDTAPTITIENSYADTSRAIIENCGDGNSAAFGDYVIIDNVYSKTAQSDATDSNTRNITGVKPLDDSCYGRAAVTTMQGLDWNIWYVGDVLPKLRSRGTTLYDVNGNDVEDMNASELVAIRNYLLNDSSEEAVARLSINDDDIFDIRDLVRFKKMLAEVVNNPYKLVWYDEFEGNSLDKTKWSFTDDMTGYTDLLTLETSEVVNVANGSLNLAAIEYTSETDENIKYATTRSVTTKDSMSYKYGYVEIEAKLPYKNGCWPSFWMKSDGAINAVNNEYFTEIDVLEVFGNSSVSSSNLHKWYNSDTTYASTHTQTAGNEKYPVTWYEFDNFENLSNEYHLYGFEWTPYEMTMYIDREKYVTYDLTYNFDNQSDMSGFHQPIYLIFNNHLYTESKPHTSGMKVTSDDLPAEYCIKSVKLYQKAGVGELNVK